VELPAAVAELVSVLATSAGVVGVALGGSRATGDADADSDWDLGVYYRGAIDLAPLARHGTVHPPGSWGRIMNGGAWLELAGTGATLEVDVLLRDLGVVQPLAAAAGRGEFQVEALLGYLAGAPTYTVLAELAIGRTLAGSLPSVDGFPAALAASAPPRWRFATGFSLDHARMRADRGDIVGAVGQVSKAILEAAHAILCARGAWVVNEKRLVERAGLGPLHAVVAAVPVHQALLTEWIEDVRARLDAALDAALAQP
jgi:hypothetical protein